MAKPNDNLEIVWGADEIGRVINRNRKQTFYLLKKGRIKAARKVGRDWHADLPGLRAQFCSDASNAGAARA